MLKMSRSIEFSKQLGEGVVGVRGDSRAGRDRNKLDGSKMNDNEVGGSKLNDEVGKKGQKTSKSKKLSKSKKTVGSSNFLTPKAKLAFTKLRQVFLKVPIHHHFNPEYHSQIEMDVLGYALGRVLSQLTWNDLG